MRSQPRSFRYGARYKLTVPLGLMFTVVAAEMSYLALQSGTAGRIFDGVMAGIAAVLAVSMLRAVIARAKGARRVVLGASELIAPIGLGSPDITIRYRDVRKVELGGAAGFARTLRVEHNGGTWQLAGAMLGTVGELDELASLLRTRTGR